MLKKKVNLWRNCVTFNWTTNSPSNLQNEQLLSITWSKNRLKSRRRQEKGLYVPVLASRLRRSWWTASFWNRKYHFSDTIKTLYNKKLPRFRSNPTLSQQICWDHKNSPWSYLFIRSFAHSVRLQKVYPSTTAVCFSSEAWYILQEQWKTTRFQNNSTQKCNAWQLHALPPLAELVLKRLTGGRWQYLQGKWIYLSVLVAVCLPRLVVFNVRSGHL